MRILKCGAPWRISNFSYILRRTAICYAEILERTCIHTWISVCVYVCMFLLFFLETCWQALCLLLLFAYFKLLDTWGF